MEVTLENTQDTVANKDNNTLLNIPVRIFNDFIFAFNDVFNRKYDEAGVRLSNINNYFYENGNIKYAIDFKALHELVDRNSYHNGLCTKMDINHDNLGNFVW